MLLRSRLFGLAAFAALLLPAAARPAGPIPPDRFDALHALIKPQAGESRWSEIPWTTDLWEARKKAAAEGKPIFFWSMSGESLGCT